MKIVIMGTGNTATVLGKKIKLAGHDIIQVYGRNTKAASDLADELNAEWTSSLPELNSNADVYLLAVSDSAVPEVAKQLQVHDKVIAHTAASVSMSALSDFNYYGVFYPLQTLKKESSYLPEIPIIINANERATLDVLNNLAHSISENVLEANDETRMKLHLAAVFSNNFVNYLYTLSERYCRKEHIDFDLLLPLIKETSVRLETIKPSAAQTGPAVRHDALTIKRHEQLLDKYPHLKNFYTLFTASIWNDKEQLG